MEKITNTILAATEFYAGFALSFLPLYLLIQYMR
jgi:hypothetical protein